MNEPAMPSGQTPVFIHGERIRQDGSRKGLACESLCATCQGGQVMERRAPKGVEPTRVIWCRMIGHPVAHDITQCSAYRDAKVMSLHDMSAIALDINGGRFAVSHAFHEKAYR